MDAYWYKSDPGKALDSQMDNYWTSPPPAVEEPAAEEPAAEEAAEPAAEPEAEAEAAAA